MSRGSVNLRARQAANTRTEVVRAARRVFGRRGYSAATIAEIAEAAGVAVPTVYKLYGSKRALLTAIADEWARVFAPRQLEDLPPEPQAALEWWAATVRKQWETGLDIALIYAGAAASEAEVRSELEPRLAARDRAIRSVAAVLRTSAGDRLDADHAAAVISALTLPEVYRELVATRGWTPDRYQSWLLETLESQLLDPGGRERPGGGR